MVYTAANNATGKVKSMQNKTTHRSESVPLPIGWTGYVKSMGPGFLAAMTLLGSGELIDVSAAGVNYGYALLWGLAAVFISKFIYIFMMSKYQMLNEQGLTLMQGFAKLGRFFPLVTGFGLLLGIFAYGSFYIPAAGTALFQLFGIGGDTWGRFIGATVAVVAGALVLRSAKAYKLMETIARIVVVGLVAVFVYSAVSQRPPLGEFLEGFLLRTPATEGLFGSVLIMVALIGAAGVTPAAIAYLYAIHEKGWQGPRYRRLQVLDLLVSIVAVVIIDSSIWITATESVRDTGLTISSEEDLATMMERSVGTIGPFLLWGALFFVAFTSITGTIHLFSRAVVDAVHNAFPARTRAYSQLQNDPISRWLLVLGLIVPLVFASPWAPNTVVLSVVAVTIPLITMPFILLGTTLLTSSSKFLPKRFVNNWWQVGLLLAIIVVSIASVVGGTSGLLETIRELLE